MINILVAHHAEGKPFRDHYALEMTDLGDLRLFCNDVVRLLITGEGATPVGESLSTLWQTLDQPRYDQWLNYGVAGSAELDVGTLVIVDKVHAAERTINASGEQTVETALRLDVPAASCTSVNEMTRQYSEHGVMDMEAATIADFLDVNGALERLTVLKLVSDCPGTPLPARGALHALINSSADEVCRVSDMILSLQQSEF